MCSEYFGGTANVSLGYCKGGRKMLVFVVLMDPAGVTSENDSIIVINKPSNQLPIAVVTFEQPRVHHHHMAGLPPHMAQMLQNMVAAGMPLPAHMAQLLQSMPGSMPGMGGAPGGLAAPAGASNVGPDGKPLPDWMHSNGQVTTWGHQGHVPRYPPGYAPPGYRAPPMPHRPRAPPPIPLPKRPKAGANWADAELRKALERRRRGH
jgi:hypothetical protein